jgi:hypothetical protein
MAFQCRGANVNEQRIIDISGDALFSRAKALLLDFVEQASQDISVVSNYANLCHLRELAVQLQQRMEATDKYPNKAYNGLAEAVARCLVLYADAPDRYASLVEGICSDEMDVFLDDWRGLATLERLVHGLSDDHGYVFNENTMTIEYENAGNRHAQGLCPAKFLVLTVAACKGETPVGPFSHPPRS